MIHINNKKKTVWLSLLLISSIVGIVLHYLHSLRFDEFSLPIRDIYAPGDGRLTIAVFKMVISENWLSLIIPQTPYLNAPFGFKVYDFPMPFFSEFLYIKLLSIFSSDSVVVFNLYYISTYFLNAFVMYWVLRRFRVNIYLAISIGVLFTFLPFHYWRLPHTFYSGYFFIPLWIYYLLLLTNKKPLFFKKKVGESKYKFDWSKRNMAIILVLLISSTWNFYYTFFFAFLIGFVLISNFIYKNSKHHIFSTLIFLSLSVSPFLANMAPYKAYEIDNGKNFQVGHRDPIESETLGLTIATLVLPYVEHRVGDFSNLGKRYAHRSLLFNESNDGTLGIVGSIGFLILVFIMFFHNQFPRILSKLSQLNLFALLLSTVGGFGVVFAYIITPQIRAYNRISMFIAAMSFIAIAIIINKYFGKKGMSRKKILLLSFVIMLFGVFDLVGDDMDFRTIDKHRSEYFSDKEFIYKIESQFDTDKQKVSIAQYPYLSLPESPGIYKMGNYEQFQGYIHSNKLYWSFGAIRGRESDAWWKDLTKKTVEEQVLILQEAGFSGIMINRNGYKDNGQSLEDKITGLTGEKPIVSDNKVLSFFELSPTGVKVSLPLTFNSFYQWEGAPGKFRWAGKNAHINLYNNQNKTQVKNMSFTLGTLKDRSMEIRLNDDTLEKIKMQRGVHSRHTYKLQLKPGKNTLRFETKEPATVPGGADNRSLLFSFGEFLYGSGKHDE